MSLYGFNNEKETYGIVSYKTELKVLVLGKAHLKCDAVKHVTKLRNFQPNILKYK